MSDQLEQLDVTAIMCPTDASTLELLELIRDRGEDALDRYSVTGFDGYGPLDSPYLGLTTYRVPREEIGRTAIDEGHQPPVEFETEYHRVHAQEPLAA